MRILRFIWHALNNVRRFVQIVITLLIIAVFVFALSGREIIVPDSVALVIAPQGNLVEQLEGDPLEQALAQARGIESPQTLLRNVVDSLELAADDDSVKAVVLELDGLQGGGIPKLKAVADAIEKVRAAGKPVIATGDSYSQAQYYLAAHADEIYMNKLGALVIDGFGYYRAFLKDALEKLKIDVNVFRVGKYKSFVEPFTRNDMSEPDREAAERWLTSLWADYTHDVEAARGLEAGSIDDYANEFVEHLDAADGNFGRAAADAGLVDVLGDRHTPVERLIGLVGPDEDDADTYSAIGMGAYLAARHTTDYVKFQTAGVGVLVASGEIVDGTAPRGMIGGDTLAGLIKQAAHNDKVRALVLRVDSPGGSMFASEVVYDALERLKATGKPLVVSMSSTAASGGYYISMPADEIWAEQSTITGSIGVGALFPTVQRTLGALGVTIDGIGTTKLTGQMRPDRALGEGAREALQLAMQDAYATFLGKVAAARDLSFDRVSNIAQGRVWIGSDAQELGLVDDIGGLDDAVQSAARLAGIEGEDYGIDYVEAPLSWHERLAMQIAIRAVTWIEPAIDSARPDGWLTRLLHVVEPGLDWLAVMNDPRNLYYHCLCRLP